MTMWYAVGSYESELYSNGYRVYEIELGFYKGKVRDFSDSDGGKTEAIKLRDKLNAKKQKENAV